MSNYIGIDIGGTKIAAGVVSSEGQLKWRGHVPTDAAAGGAAVLGRAIDLAYSIIEHAGFEDIEGIGIGAGGQIDAKRGVVLAASEILPGWTGINIASGFGRKFDMPVYADNDVNALASGEHGFGVARGLDTVVFLALGTGVGGALIIGGRIHHGAHWAGGEAGHMIVDSSDAARVDRTGVKGSLEAYASGPGLVMTYSELTGKSLNTLRGEDVVADANSDAAGPGAEAIRMTGRYLGLALVTLANVIDPDMIVIGGGLSSIGDRLLEPARNVLRSQGVPGPAECPVSPASLGADASIVGAASLAMRQSSAVEK